jgi:hypothetical protein
LLLRRCIRRLDDGEQRNGKAAELVHESLLESRRFIGARILLRARLPAPAFGYRPERTPKREAASTRNRDTVGDGTP